MFEMMLSACIVIGVADGDSLKVKCPTRKAAISVRLAEVDAPEIVHKAFGIREQPYGREAKAALTALCLKKTAVVHTITLDRYRRSVAHVDCDGTDASSYQVANGHAWAFLPKRGSKIPALEAVARSKKLGLWALPDPVPPSEWRKK